MLQEFSAQYFFTSLGFGPDEVQDVRLVDADLVRGNGATETATISGTNFEIFDGYRLISASPTPGQPNVFLFFEGEVSTTVTFDDGTSLSGVLALRDFEAFSFGLFTDRYLFDVDRLAAAGQTLADVADVRVDAIVDHDLSWADLGFTATGVSVPDPEPEPEPEPEPDPVLNLIAGTAGNDRLVGSNGADLIIGGGDDDRLTGGLGADTFVFGAEARDRDRDRDVITDFALGEDTIVFEAGAMIRFIEQRGDDLFIQLQGDRDAIVVRDADRGVVADFQFVDDLFLA